jgi:hypothetical protein
MMTNPRSSRTPKVKQFVHPPFWKCPDCHSENSFGVLMICDRHYVRRCITCWFDQSLPLPVPKKQIIYLDQFVISNIAKELSQTASSATGFYKELFCALDRLSKLQLIVCPDSPLRDHESLVDTRYEKFRSVFRHLSNGISFRDPKTLLHAEIHNAFDRWRGAATRVKTVSRGFALTRSPDVWQDHYRIDLQYTVPGLVDELQTNRKIVTARLATLCEEWRGAYNFDFDDVFSNEVAAHAKVILGHYGEFLYHYGRVAAGQEPVDDRVCFPSPEVSLMTRLVSDLMPVYPDPDERHGRIREFFSSDDFRSVSGVRVGALFWATIAREIYRGRKRLPTAGIYNDIDAVAMYAPFCDAMFIDKEVSYLIKQPELQRELNGRTRFFSLAKREQGDFLAYLKAVERDANPQHLQAVAEVYGPDGAEPFMDLLRREVQPNS